MEDTYDYALKADPLAEEIAGRLQWHMNDLGYKELVAIVADCLEKSDAVYIRLTPREAEIVRRILDGAGVKQLAKDHDITMKRVQLIYKKAARKIHWYQERYRARRIAAESKTD